MGSQILSIILAAFAAMSKIFVVALVGIYFSKNPKENPILSVSFLKTLSQLSNQVFLPALIISSIGSALSIELLRRLWILALISIINSSLSYLIAHTIGKALYEKDDAMFKAFTVACASPNAISLPIMVMQTLCDNPIINKTFGGDVVMCGGEASAMLFVYSIGWHITFFSYSITILRDLINPNNVEKFSWREWTKNVPLNPTLIAIYIGLIIGLVPALQDCFYNNPSGICKPIGSALLTVGNPIVCVNTLIMAATLAHIDFPPFDIDKHIEKFVFGPSSNEESKATVVSSLSIATSQRFTYNPLVCSRSTYVTSDEIVNSSHDRVVIPISVANGSNNSIFNTSISNTINSCSKKSNDAAIVTSSSLNNGEDQAAVSVLDNIDSNCISSSKDNDNVSTTSGFTLHGKICSSMTNKRDSLELGMSEAASAKPALPKLRSILAHILCRYAVVKQVMIAT